VAREGRAAGEADIGDFSKLLPAVHIREMYLHRRQADRLQRVQDGDAGVGIGRGVDYNAVENSVSGLDRVHDRALVVGLKKFDRNAAFRAVGPNGRAEGGVVGFAVELRLPQTEQI